MCYPHFSVDIRWLRCKPCMSMLADPSVARHDREAPGGALLQVHSLRKSYGPTVALESVSFDLVPGEIHALLGENGAGKSTIVKLLNGIVQPEQGRMELGGALYAPRSITVARQHGVSTAFQELSLLPNLTVASNLLLPSAIKGPLGLISERQNVEKAEALLAEFGVTDVDPRGLVAGLPLASRQRIEIVRALGHRPRLLVLDEPTAALAEPEWLFGLLEKVTASGCAVIYISHRLSEVRRLCSRGTVLRNGCSIGTVPLRDVADSKIFEMMVGVSQRGNAGSPTATKQMKPALTLENVSGRNVRDVSLTVHQGEILGVAALEGQGQRELFRILAGLEKLEGGRVLASGASANLGTPKAALTSGIGFLPEERKTEGIFAGLRTASNISIANAGRISRLGFIGTATERGSVAEIAGQMDLPPRFLGRPIEALSGGNQQKALLARVMVSGARHLVLYDPTRGVDVGTKQTIYASIRRFVETGGSALVYSTELAELVQLCDRCVVLYGGQVAAVYQGQDMHEERLVAAATGHGVH
jgi:ribose transport system ATP-binding protein